MLTASVWQTKCLRCPHGVHIAGEPVPINVSLLDVYGNILAFCDPASEFCLAHEHEQVQAQLWLGDEEFTHTLFTAHSVTSMEAGRGKAVFEDLRIAGANLGYFLRFRTPGKSFSAVAGGEADRVIKIDTSMFAVTSGRPVGHSKTKHSS